MFAWISPVWACGGMVCDPGPLESIVVQNAERIAFKVDEDAGIVEAHVQIFYEGPPDQFGWVVPVSSQPEVFISTDALFMEVFACCDIVHRQINHEIWAVSHFEVIFKN